MVRIAVVSDSHLSARTPEASSNWDAIVKHLRRRAPRLVIHLGDIAADGPGHPEDLEFARTRFDDLDAEWRAVPGNHDVGDNGHPEELPVSDVLLERFREHFGSDRWAVTLGDWTLVGVDSQLFGSGLDAEADQDAWLDGLLGTDARVAVFVHKPLSPSEAEREGSPSARFLPPAAAARLCRPGVEVIMSGHVHQYRQLPGSPEAIWAPTTWATLPERVQPTVGTKVVGLLELELGDTVAHDLERPAGIRQLEIGRDARNPY